jgi:hypothetical protein
MTAGQHAAWPLCMRDFASTCKNEYQEPVTRGEKQVVLETELAPDLSRDVVPPGHRSRYYAVQS